MRTKIAALIFLLVTASACLARQDPLQELMTRADAASDGQQADLCMQVAERELKLATDSYKQNKIEDGRASLQQIIRYSDKAQAAAVHSGKKLKHTEIKIRQIAGHLRNLKYNVDVDDQPIVQSAVDKLEDFRTDLLKAMFGSKSND
jgi:hypothetical protein